MVRKTSNLVENIRISNTINLEVIMSNAIEILKKVKEFLNRINIKQKIMEETFFSLSLALLENLEFFPIRLKGFDHYIHIFMLNSHFFLHIEARFKKKCAIYIKYMYKLLTS